MTKVVQKVLLTGDIRFSTEAHFLPAVEIVLDAIILESRLLYEYILELIAVYAGYHLKS